MTVKNSPSKQSMAMANMFKTTENLYAFAQLAMSLLQMLALQLHLVYKSFIEMKVKEFFSVQRFPTRNGATKLLMVIRSSVAGLKATSLSILQL